jgi:NADPH-dependent glutamate synthase beta subunit-like oxidoreductase
MYKHSIDDARRCLRCKKPTCARGCPVQTPICDAIALPLDSRLRKAARVSKRVAKTMDDYIQKKRGTTYENQ